MIVVTGATGTTGGGAGAAARRGGRARPGVGVARKSASIQRLGVETALGDFEQPDTLDAAMAGCDHVFLLSPPSPHQPEQERNAIDAAKRVGVGHVVALSVLGPARMPRWRSAAGTARSTGTWPSRACPIPFCCRAGSCRTSWRRPTMSPTRASCTA